MLFGATLRSEYPHAQIRKIDADAARALDGVHAVLTHADVPGDPRHGLVENDWPVFAGGPYPARYVGDPIALAVAETAEIAQQALALIHVDYEVLPAVTDPRDALQPDAPQLHPDRPNRNLLKHIKVRHGDVEQGFRGRCHRRTHLPHADDRARLPGAGMRAGRASDGLSGQDLYNRQESLIFHPKRHSAIIRIKTGAMRDGTLTAVEAELYGDSGAYASLGEKVMTRATTHATGPYVMPHARIDCYAMYTNNAPSGTFRGFGVTQSTFAVESNLDILAEELDMDPTELRRKNVMRVGAKTATGQELIESVGLLECLDVVEEEIKASATPDPSSLTSDPWTPIQIGSKRYACGIAAGYKNTGLRGGAPPNTKAEVEVFPDGTAAVRTSSAEMGQNLVGVLAACTAQELGLPFEKVHVTVMDTGLTPDGGPSNAIYNAVDVRCLALPVDQNALLLAMRDGEIEIDGYWGQTGEWLAANSQPQH